MIARIVTEVEALAALPSMKKMVRVRVQITYQLSSIKYFVGTLEPF